MRFSHETMKVGGLIDLPDSMIAKSLGVAAGEITEVNHKTIKVEYPNNTAKSGKITAIYSYAWLNSMYGDKDTDKEPINDQIPF